jgi:hypothetical protein
MHRSLSFWAPRKALLAGAILSSLALGSAGAQVHFGTFNIDASQEVPPSGTAGTGTVTLTLDVGAGTAQAVGTYQNLAGNASTSHLHAAPIGQNGGIVIPLNASGGTSGTIFAGGAVNAAQVALILAGGTYVNIHTSLFPAGEIRGQAILPWELWSPGSPCATGAIPDIACVGGFSSGSANSMDLSNAPPSTPIFLVLGLSSLRAPFKGGVLGPTPDFIIPLGNSSAAGTFSLPYVLSPVPPGINLWVQYWIKDPGVPSTFCSTTTILGTTQ